MLTEMKSQPAKSSRHTLPKGEIDPDTLAAIRALLNEETPRKTQRETAASPEAVVSPQTEEPIQRPLRAAQLLQEIVPLSAPQPQRSQQQRTLAQVVDSLKSYRPRAFHAVSAGFVLLLIFQPWVLIWSFVVVLVATIAALAYLGMDEFCQRCWTASQRFARRHPRQAAGYRQAYGAIADRWNGMVANLPEALADAIFLPDLKALAARQAAHQKAWAKRFDAMRKDLH